MPFQTTTIIYFTLAILVALLIQRLRSPLSKLPGPFYTRFSRIWLILLEFTGRRRLYVHELHKQYGPVVRIAPNEVSFVSGEAIKEIYTSGKSGYDKTEFYDLFMQFGTRTLFSTLGKGEHSAKKRYIAGQYANTNVMRPQVMGGIKERVDVFIKKCTEVEGKSVDAYVYLHCFALDVATHNFFGPYGTHSLEDEEDFKFIQELSFHNGLPLFVLQYYFPNLVNLLFKLTNIPIAPLSRSYIFNSCAQPDPGTHTLLHKLRSGKDFFTPLEIAAECMDHMAAGIDTTGDALCFLMYHISLPPNMHIQEKLFQEFAKFENMNETNSENPNGNGEKGWEALEYLDAVIKEGLRLFGPIPMSQPRYVPKGGREIDGYFIPENTIVGAQGWSVHLLNEAVFPNPESFVPERWMSKDAERILEMNRLFFAFGVGARGCTGRHLAIAEMKVLLKEVYSKFRTRVGSDMKGRMDISDQIISSRPKDQSCMLVFERRND